MRFERLATAMLVLGLAACKPTAPQEPPAQNQPAPALPSAQAPVGPANIALPDDRTPLEEPHGPIDPKSSEGAGQVVQHYGALIEQNRFAEANKLWRDAASAAAFRKALPPSIHVEIGKPGDTEGAAGSIYITVPVIFYADHFRRAADVVLRRVNDVPGSTEAQRRWHIDRIDWTTPA